MTSLRLSSLVLVGGLAVAIGATSGASLDTQPLRWGASVDWRQHLPRTEDLAKTASRRNEAFETVGRSRQARNLHLAEDQVIYLLPIDTIADGDMPPEPLESHSGQMPRRASSQEVVLEVGPQQRQVVPQVDEMDQDRHRFADAGLKVVEFPSSSQVVADWVNIDRIQSRNDGKSAARSRARFRVSQLLQALSDATTVTDEPERR